MIEARDPVNGIEVELKDTVDTLGGDLGVEETVVVELFGFNEVLIWCIPWCIDIDGNANDCFYGL